MKEAELRKVAICAACHQPFGHSGSPLFWRVTVERHGVLLDKVRRQDGLAQFMGNAFLAQVMGPNEEMTKSVMGPVTLTLCDPCALSSQELALLAEQEESCRTIGADRLE